MTSTIKTVLVLGGGAKASYVAARLVEKGIRVTMMTRPDRCARIALKGVQIASLDGSFRRPIPAIISTEISTPYDLVIVACASHLLVDALDLAAAAMRAGTAVLTLADGGPHLQFLRRRYSLRPVLEAIFEARLVVDGDGVIRHRPPAARIQLRHDRHDAALLAEVAELLTGRGLNATVVDDFDHLIWVRSIYLAASVGTMLHTQRPLRDSLRLTSGGGHFQYMLREGREIAGKFGVTVPRSAVTAYARGLTFEGEPIGPPPSICTAGGGGAEAHFLLAAIVDRGEQKGCAVPSLKMALRLADRSVEPFAVAV